MAKKRIISFFIVFLLIVANPMAAFAADGDPTTPATTPTTPSTTTTTPATTTTTPPAPTPTTTPSSTTTSTTPSTPPAPNTAKGPSSPPGPDSNTYKYNSATGLWENNYYTWDPSTQQTSPKVAPNYSYNPKTGLWDTTKWQYDAASGKYVPNVVSVPTNPLAPQGMNGPANNALAGNGVSTSSGNGFFNGFTNVNISNSLNSNAVSGDASVISNTLGGSALSGQALTTTDLINLLQSSWGGQTPSDLLTFTTNIAGNTVGDLHINPSAITGGQLSNTNNQTQNLNVVAQNNGQINNNVNLAANSGNATVANNTQAGSATSGNATAMANVVNLLNSTIAAGNSFLGVININGNLNGDILLPNSTISQLLASNAPGSNNKTQQTQTTNANATVTNNTNINNNVNLGASSGNANVGNNTTAGSATTGAAKTNLTTLNLINQQISGTDGLLVFVNVLGTWHGFITQVPVGTTAAAFGQGISQSSNSTTNTNTNLTNNNAINNNITATAKSGDASVSGNTQAGNATSGNATASANIANISNSQVSLSNWFGMLFINVLGTWNGSFGVDTSAGNTIVTKKSSHSTTSQIPPVFSFTSKSSQSTGLLGAISNQIKTAQANVSVLDKTTKKSSSVLGASTNSNPRIPEAAGQGINWIVPVISFFMILGLLGIGISYEYIDKLRNILVAKKINKASSR